MPVKLPDDNSLLHKPLIDADKAAQVIVFFVGVAVFGLVLAYR